MNKLNRLILSLPLLIALQSHAQQNTLSSGGEAKGTNGTVSYSIGQVDYVNETNVSGSVYQGVQQPYSIAVLTGEEVLNIDLEMKIYPNPAVHQLTLFANAFDSHQYLYQLIDINGIMLQSGNVSNKETKILMHQYQTAIYLLKIIENNFEVKTFKIVKN